MEKFLKLIRMYVKKSCDTTNKHNTSQNNRVSFLSNITKLIVSSLICTFILKLNLLILFLLTIETTLYENVLSK